MSPSHETNPSDAVLDATMIAELRASGEERTFTAGTVLYEAGDPLPDFFVVLEGEVAVVRPGDDEVRVATWAEGAFLGELNLLTGQRPLMTARATTDGRVLVIPLATFRHLMGTRTDFSDIVFRAFLARRSILRAGDGASAIRIVGSRYSADALALRSFADRSRLPFTWIDLEEVDDPAGFLAAVGAQLDDVPIVLTPTARLVRPSPGQLAEHLGLTYHSAGTLCDLVVVGTGPAGLAAAVYGASEGLDTLSIDAVAMGGQAGTSSRIENYVGFPNGISGGDLAARAAAQAVRLGARLNAPCEAAGLRTEHGVHVVTLTDGTEVSARAVIVASGAHYRRLDVAELERFEGAGVYYAATDLETRLCKGQPVIVVGGGNSAGQAAIYLAQQGCTVTIVIRGTDLAKNMSRYLIDRIEANEHIAVQCETEVRALAGDQFLEAVTLEATASGARQTVAAAGLFSFIGAVPATEWLDGAVALDRLGFILTDRALPERADRTRDPLPYETSAAGIFAAGDVRHDSVKRVAAAVGEGSSAVRSVFEYLT